MEQDNLGYSVKNARSAEQADEMQQASGKKICLFCEINLQKNKPLNKLGEFDPESKDWPLLYVWENPYPQDNHARHIMILPKRHINNEDFFLLCDQEWLQIFDAWKWAVDFYHIAGGGFVGRFGKRSHNAGTIGHLHFQLQIPDLSGNVKATFCKDQSAESEARRANERAYRNNTVEGFLITDINGHMLNAKFHWQELPDDSDQLYVHSFDAIGFISDIFSENEIRPALMMLAMAIKENGSWSNIVSRMDPLPFSSEIF